MKELKKIMTDLAAGHITEAESEILVGELEVKTKKKTQKRTNKRKEEE